MTSTRRSDAITFGVIAVAYGAYFLSAASGQRDLGETLAAMVGLCIGVVVLMIAAHAAAALLLGRPSPEALSLGTVRSIDGRAAQAGYWTMMSMLWAVPFLLALPSGEVVAANAVVGIVGAAELARYGWQLAQRAGCRVGGETRLQNQAGLP